MFLQIRHKTQYTPPQIMQSYKRTKKNTLTLTCEQIRTIIQLLAEKVEKRPSTAQKLQGPRTKVNCNELYTHTVSPKSVLVNKESGADL